VKIGTQQIGGTGFFVAPGQILTCAHVVQAIDSSSASVEVTWQDQHFSAQVIALHPNPDQDLALLSLDMTDHPCAWLHSAIEIGDSLWCYGYPDEYRSPGSGDSVSFVYEGDSLLEGNRLLKLKGGQTRPGLSGAPLLNRRTNGVCGVVKSTRNRDFDLGGHAVPVSTIFDTFGGIELLQQEYYQIDATWLRLREQCRAIHGSHEQTTSEDKQSELRIEPGQVPTRTNPARLTRSAAYSVPRVPPAKVRSFTGRRTELGQIDSILRGQASAGITTIVIHGLSGVGKTQLCREYLDSHTDDYKLIRWISADDQTTMAMDLSKLAIDLQLSGADPQDLMASSTAALGWLEQSDHWLLIFDNATPNSFGSLMPSRGSGDILISSTSPNWSAFTTNELRLQGLSVDDATQFLMQRTGSNDLAAATRIAVSFDGLPLALEQASSFVQKARIGLTDYEQLLEKHRPELLDDRSPFTDYPESVYSALMLNIHQAYENSSHVTELLAFIAYLNPNVIPRDLVRVAMRDCYQQIRDTFNDFKFNKLVSELVDVSLIFADSRAISIHPLVQAFMRDSMEDEHKAAWPEFVLSVLAYEFPEDVDDSSTWPTCDSLISHVTSAIELSDFQCSDDEWVRALYWHAGSYLHARGKDADAIPLLEKALEQAVSVLGPDHPQIALASNNLLNALAEVGRVDEALKLGARATEILTNHQEVQAEFAVNLGKLYSNIGRIYLHHKKDYRVARFHFNLALEIHLEILGQDHYTTAIDRNNLGTVDRAQAIWATNCGNRHAVRSGWEKAYDHFYEAVKTHRAVLSTTDYRLAIALFNLGQASNNLERFAEAERYLREAVTINELFGFGAKGSDQIDALLGLGHTLQALGRSKEAISYFDRAKEIATSLYGPSSPEVQSITRQRGNAAFDLIRPFFCVFNVADVDFPH
jgi:tetratricopeptide (TPR) repeat protein